MAKTKRMFMGGAAKAVSQAAMTPPPKGGAALQSMSNRPRGGAAPQFMSDRPRGGAAGASTMGVGTQGLGQAMTPPPQLQFMSDKLRGGAAGAPTMGAGMQGLGQAMGSMPQGSPAKLGQLGAAMGGMQAKFGPPSIAPGAPRTMGGMGMKSGGTASSRADGCATKGKTKGRFV